MVKKQPSKIDFAALQRDLQRQFRNLDPKDPSLRPTFPKALLCAFIALGVAAVLWFALLTDYEAELEAERSKELVLRGDYSKKLGIKPDVPATPVA